MESSATDLTGPAPPNAEDLRPIRSATQGGLPVAWIASHSQRTQDNQPLRVGSKVVTQGRHGSVGELRSINKRSETIVEATSRQSTSGGTSLRGSPADDVTPSEAASVDILSRRDHFGILSNDLDAASGDLWGTSPQTYSMAGIINAAMRSSRSWEEVWCLDL